MTFPKYSIQGAANGDPAPILVNGVDLQTLAYNFSTRTGMHNASGLRGSNPVTPGKDGSTWRPGKRREENTLRWSMWASPLTPAGTMPTSKAVAYANWRANQDRLNALFDSSYGMIRIVQGGRECYADILGSIDPEMAYGQVGEFNVDLTLPDVFWQDTSDFTWSTPSGAGAIGIHAMTTFAGATAPLNDLSFAVAGPITNPVVTDVVTSHQVNYVGAIAAGQIWTVNAKNWTSTVAGVNRTAATFSFGLYAPRLLTITPKNDPSLGPEISLAGTGPGVGTQLTVVGRRKFR